MRLAYPGGKHKNQSQEHLSTIYGNCQIVEYKISYKVHMNYEISPVCGKAKNFRAGHLLVILTDKYIFNENLYNIPIIFR